MSLDNADVVDAVGTEEQTGIVILNLLDSWDWKDERKHLVALQAKLNAYLNFIESRQIYEAYPEAAGKVLRIDVICRYPIPEVAKTFLQKASIAASDLDVLMTHRVQ